MTNPCPVPKRYTFFWQIVGTFWDFVSLKALQQIPSDKNHSCSPSDFRLEVHVSQEIWNVFFGYDRIGTIGWWDLQFFCWRHGCVHGVLKNRAFFSCCKDHASLATTAKHAQHRSSCPKVAEVLMRWGYTFFEPRSKKKRVLYSFHQIPGAKKWGILKMAKKYIIPT